MGKVNQLAQDERLRRLRGLFKKYKAYDYTDDEAWDMAEDDLEAEDAANGQFGVGA